MRPGLQATPAGGVLRRRRHPRTAQIGSEHLQHREAICVNSEPDSPPDLNCNYRRHACCSCLALKESLMLAIRWVAVSALQPNSRNVRIHSNKQVRQIADSIRAVNLRARPRATREFLARKVICESSRKMLQ